MMRRNFRLTLIVQVSVAVFLASLVAVALGFHAAVSVGVGGLIGAAGTLVLAVFVQIPVASARDTVRLALRAEGLRVLLMLGLLGLTIAVYPDLVLAACVAAFVLSVLLSGLAFIVSENEL